MIKYIFQLLHTIYNQQNKGDMSEQDQVVEHEGQQHRRRCRFNGVKIKDFCTIGSSLLVPLVLGIFTIIITHNQQKEAVDL